MNAVLRITRMWFGFVPVQRGLNYIAGGLFLLALLLACIGSKSAEFPAALGAAFMLFTPAFGGGPGLRHFSGLHTSRLLPDVRRRAIAGVTLAITLMAVIATLPVLLAHFSEAMGSTGAGMARFSPLRIFAIAWTCAAFACMVTFIASESAPIMLLAMLVPVVVNRNDLPVENYIPGVNASFILALACWTGFSAWFLRARTFAPPLHLLRRMPLLGARNVSVKARKDQTPFTRTAALRCYLHAAASPIGHFARSAVILAVIPIMWQFRNRSGELQFPVLFMGMLALICAASGFELVRRARLLWLRAGVDRDALFRITERLGVTAAPLVFCMIAAGLAAWFMFQRPDLAVRIALGLIAQMTLVIGLFYGSLGFTGKWNPVDVLLGLALCAWLVASIALTRPTAALPGTLLTLVAISAVAVVLLRLRARWKWRQVDWRTT